MNNGISIAGPPNRENVVYYFNTKRTNCDLRTMSKISINYKESDEEEEDGLVTEVDRQPGAARQRQNIEFERDCDYIYKTYSNRYVVGFTIILPNVYPLCMVHE